MIPAHTISLEVCAIAAALFLVSCKPTPITTENQSDKEISQGAADRRPTLVQVQCGPCHGVDGNTTNPEIPKLGGQKREYLYGQLLAMRSGDRVHAKMPSLSSITDTELGNLAEYYSAQKREPDFPVDAILAARGRKIYYANSSSPAGCASCHDASPPSRIVSKGGRIGSTAVPAPTLYGQHASYLSKRLHDFARGGHKRGAMCQVASALGEEDRRAVAAFLSGQRP